MCELVEFGHLASLWSRCELCNTRSVSITSAFLEFKIYHKICAPLNIKWTNFTCLFLFFLFPRCNDYTFRDFSPTTSAFVFGTEGYVFSPNASCMLWRPPRLVVFVCEHNRRPAGERHRDTPAVCMCGSPAGRSRFEIEGTQTERITHTYNARSTVYCSMGATDWWVGGVSIWHGRNQNQEPVTVLYVTLTRPIIVHVPPVTHDVSGAVVKRKPHQ
jgi:hypothetical protein